MDGIMLFFSYFKLVFEVSFTHNYLWFTIEQWRRHEEPGGKDVHSQFFCPFVWIVPVFMGEFVVCVWFYKEFIHPKKKRSGETEGKGV